MCKFKFHVHLFLSCFWLKIIQNTAATYSSLAKDAVSSSALVNAGASAGASWEQAVALASRKWGREATHNALLKSLPWPWAAQLICEMRTQLMELNEITYGASASSGPNPAAFLKGFWPTWLAGQGLGKKFCSAHSTTRRRTSAVVPRG